MLSNMIVITSVICYFIVVIISFKRYYNMSFSGNEAAGNAMAKGLTFFYGLGILFLISIFLTIINAFFYKGINIFWIKFLFFTPIGFPLFILILMFFDVRLPYFNLPYFDTSSKYKKKKKEIKLAQELIFEIRTRKKINNIGLVFNNTKNKSIVMYMLAEKIENGFYTYKHKNTFNSKNNHSFYISIDNYETAASNLSIPNNESSIPFFTSWKTIYGIHQENKEPVKLEFRYKIIEYSV